MLSLRVPQCGRSKLSYHWSELQVALLTVLTRYNLRQYMHLGTGDVVDWSWCWVPLFCRSLSQTYLSSTSCVLRFIRSWALMFAAQMFVCWERGGGGASSFPPSTIQTAVKLREIVEQYWSSLWLDVKSLNLVSYLILRLSFQQLRLIFAYMLFIKSWKKKNRRSF